MEEQEPVAPETAPMSLNDILADIKGFGVEDFEQILTLDCGGKQVQLRLSNITTEDERIALLAVEEFKGYTWIQEVRCEILSRSITYLNGVDLRGLAGQARLVVDPIDKMQKDIQVVLRNTLKNWGQELVQVLWKVLMVHSQKIEDRLFESFPEAATMTDVERRYIARAQQEAQAITEEVIKEGVADLFDEKS